MKGEGEEKKWYQAMGKDKRGHCTQNRRQKKEEHKQTKNKAGNHFLLKKLTQWEKMDTAVMIWKN